MLLWLCLADGARRHLLRHGHVPDGAVMDNSSEALYVRAAQATIQQMLDVASHVLALPHLMIARAAIRILEHAKRGDRIWIVGNGGSFSNAEHIALDLTRTGGIRHVFSPGSSGMLSASANDEGWPNVFENWLSSRAYLGDLLILLSCSKTSENIMRAAEFAQAHGLEMIGLWGKPAHEGADRYVDLNIYVDSDDYRTIETCHLAIGQWWAAILADVGKSVLE